MNAKRLPRLHPRFAMLDAIEVRAALASVPASEYLGSEMAEPPHGASPTVYQQAVRIAERKLLEAMSTYIACDGEDRYPDEGSPGDGEDADEPQPAKAPPRSAPKKAADENTQQADLFGSKE